MQVQVAKQNNLFVATITSKRKFDILEHIKLEDDTGFSITSKLGMMTAEVNIGTENEAKFLALLNELFRIQHNYVLTNGKI